MPERLVRWLLRLLRGDALAELAALRREMAENEVQMAALLLKTSHRGKNGAAALPEDMRKP